MHSPEVLKAIYALEHGQSVDRMAQTLLQFGVTRAEIEVLLNDHGDEHSGIVVGNNWGPLAERIACERAARGWPVVSLEMLRRATTTSARVETVRINAQNRRISLIGSAAPAAPTSGLSSPQTSRLRPESDPHFFSHPGGPPPVISAVGSAPTPAAPPPVPARTTIVPVSKTPFSALPVPVSLQRDLERATQLLASQPSVEFTLPKFQIEGLKSALRAFIETAEELAAPPPTPFDSNSVSSLGSRPGW